VDINDLVQTATEGLLVAINRWSFEKSEAGGARLAMESHRDAAESSRPAEAVPETVAPEITLDVPRFSRLATYATWWMRILLTDSVIEQRCVVVRAKNPKVRKALFNLPLVINKLDLKLPLAGSDVARIAEYLGISARETEEALNHAAGDVMLDEPVGDGSMLRGDMLADERAEGEDGILSRLASTERWNDDCEALMALPPRDRFILITRYLVSPKWKLDRLSDTLKMSRERIRQIGVDGLGRIRETISGTKTMTERRRPGRPPTVSKALIPLLRESRTGDDGGGHMGKRGAAVGRSAEAEVMVLIQAVERASASSDPEDLATFLRDQKLTIGPTRIVKSHPTADRIEALPRSAELERVSRRAFA
jgi:DNA-directed RNA polymerase specialized sigma subunit